MGEPRASVIVLAYNGAAYLAPCLDAVLAQERTRFEVIVVDNGSSDGSADLVGKQFPHVQLIRNERNLGFAAGNNVGLREASGEVLVLLNQDTVVQPGWLAALVEALENYSGAGIVGSKILDMDGQTLQHAGGYIDHPLALGQHYGHNQLDGGQFDEPCQVEFVTGAAMAFTREVLSRIGNLDEGFFPGYFEDVDFCLRARAAGYQVWYVPQAVTLHHESARMRSDPTRGHYYYYRNRLRFVLKHYTPTQITSQFVPAEITRIPRAPFEELRASTLSTIEGMLMWPSMAWQRRPVPTPGKYEAVLAALRTLQDTALMLGAQADRSPATSAGESRGSDPASGTEHSQEAAQAPEPALPQDPTPATDSPLELASTIQPTNSRIPDSRSEGEMIEPLASESHLELRRELELLQHTWQVTPRSFVSRVPVLGPVITGFRNLVNNLATRWYVQALLDQQVAFNANVTRLLNAHVTEFEHLAVEISRSLVNHSQRIHEQGQRIDNHGERIYDQGQNDASLAQQVADLHWQLLTLKSQLSHLEEEIHEQGRAAKP